MGAERGVLAGEDQVVFPGRAAGDRRPSYCQGQGTGPHRSRRGQGQTHQLDRNHKGLADGVTRPGPRKESPMSTPARTRVPNAIFPAEAHVAAEAIIAPVNALRTAVAECALDGKLHPLRNAIMRSSAWLLNNA